MSARSRRRRARQRASAQRDDEFVARVEQIHADLQRSFDAVHRAAADLHAERARKAFLDRSRRRGAFDGER